MSTPLNRRAFLTRLAAAAGLTALAARASAKPPYTIAMDPALPGSDVTDHYAERVFRVEGVGVKVPSNRVRVWSQSNPDGTVVYNGDWDGTFRLERGCSNPAYILADLIERDLKQTLGGCTDWVVSDCHGSLNWPMLYDWGKWADEMVAAGLEYRGGPEPLYAITAMYLAPRFTVNTVCQTREDMVTLRETLRMHCLAWQAQDPRYRTSWPV